MTRLAFTAMGMVSSLGLDVVTSCAAARAGVVRGREMDDFPVRSLVDGEEAGLVGHAIPEVTRGFEGFARLLRLTHAALADLRRGESDAFFRGARLGYYVSFPPPRRVYDGLPLLPDDEARRERAERAKEAERELDPASHQRLLSRAARLAGFTREPALEHAALSGHTGFAEALHRASSDLLAGRVDAAVVGGIDSLLEASTVRWLEATERLKTMNAPVGLQPAEGAAFLVLETERAAQSRGVGALGWLEAVSMGRESRPWSSGQTPVADGLTQAIAAAAEGMENAPPWLIVDHAGEAYSAMEWGMALVRLRAARPAFADPWAWYPAAYFGDAGAAAGAMAACVALRAFARGYAPARRAILTSASDGPARTAIRIAAPERSG